jgi:hypothetical protein
MCYIQHCHHLREFHHKPLEKQSETAALSCPWYIYLVNSMFPAFGSRNSRMYIYLILKQVEVPPLLFLSVMDTTTFVAAFRALEFCATLEIYVYVDLPIVRIDINVCYMPGFYNAYRQLQERTKLW